MVKILIVDDDTLLIKLYKSFFEREGFKVMVALNGKEGLEKVKQGKPDLILSDTMMPELDGFEFLKKIKKSPKTKKIPVVVMSNLANEEDVKAALEAGAIKHISKREKGPKEIVEEIKKIMSSSDRKESNA